jgi:tetratricopeptide (TPR) repeat protein
LWSEYALNDAFWLAFLFGADGTDVAELVARTRDLARAEVKRVDVVELSGPGDVEPALGLLLAKHGHDVAATWVTETGSAPAESRRTWTLLLRRLNERRDGLQLAHPCGLILACPAGSLPLARDEAPDLWSFRSLTAIVDSAGPPAVVPPPRGAQARAPDRANPFLPVAGEPLQAGEPVRALLQQAASAVRAGRGHAAVSAASQGLAAASTADDEILAHAWLARAREQLGDHPEARRHARQALSAGRPLGTASAVTLLRILAAGPDSADALAAASALVEVRRQSVQRFPEAPESLRDLSISLDKVADVQRARGELAEALTGYTESLQLRRRIRQAYGETLESLRDLSLSLNKVADVQQARGQLAEALTGYTESLQLRRRIRQAYGETPESLRDLSISLNNVAGVQQARGQLAEARVCYGEALEWYSALEERYGPPIADADELERLREAAARAASSSP